MKFPLKQCVFFMGRPVCSVSVIGSDDDEFSQQVVSWVLNESKKYVKSSELSDLPNRTEEVLFETALIGGTRKTKMRLDFHFEELCIYVKP